MNKVNISYAARNDLVEIKNYIAGELENPSAANRAVFKITKAIALLKSHAFAGAKLSSIANVERDYRYLVCGNYMVFYRVLKNDVFVDRILYGRRDYMRILFGSTEAHDKIEQ